MKYYFLYLRYVLKHIGYVRRTCFACQLYRQGILHDLSKFLPGEFVPYARNFFPTKRDKFGDVSQTVKNNFDIAWKKHIRRNPHHWEHWVIPQGNGKDKALEMPERFVREMLCDWWGAGMAITGKADIIYWYESNKTNIILHPNTRKKVEAYLPLFNGFENIQSIIFPTDIETAYAYYQKHYAKKVIENEPDATKSN